MYVDERRNRPYVMTPAGPAYLVSAGDVGVFDTRDFGDVARNTKLLQSAIDHCRDRFLTCLLPAGRIYLDDTLHLGYGDPTVQYPYTGCEIRGVLESWDGVDHGTVIIAEFLDRPPINIQSSPWTRLSEFTVVGQNVYTPAWAHAPWPLRDVASYYVPGLEPGRYAPYSGIVINGRAGRLHGGQVTIQGVTLVGFEVGFAVNPDGTGGGLGNTISFTGGRIEYCAYCVSVCDANGRNIQIQHSLLGHAHTCLTNNTHGLQSGFPPLVVGGEWNSSYRAFDMSNGIAAFQVQGVSFEHIATIGKLGGGAQSAEQPSKLTGCAFYFGSDASVGELQNGEAIGLTCGGPVSIESSTFSTRFGVFNTIGDGQPVFKDCTFSPRPLDATAWPRDWSIGLGTPTYRREVQTDNCQFAAPGLPLLDPRGTFASPINDIPIASARATLSRGSMFARIGQTQYRIEVPPIWIECTAAQMRVGDVVFGRIKDTNPCVVGAANRAIPCMVWNGTGLDCLYDADQLDPTWSFTPLRVAPDIWAPTAPFTGSWAQGNKTIVTNVAADTVLRVGDFILGAGLAANTRVETVTPQLTVSEPTLASGDGAPLYFARLIPM